MSTIFPQANNMNWIFQILKTFNPSGEQSSSIAEKLNIHNREGAYYLAALEFIGLAEKRGTDYYLSVEGLEIYSEEQETIQFTKFADCFFRNKTLSEMYRKSRDFTSSEDRKNFYSKYIHVNFGLKESTAKRRASTINSWFCWFDDKIGNHIHKEEK